MKQLKNLLASLLILLGIVGAPLLAPASTFAAIDPTDAICSGTGGNGGANCSGNSTQGSLTTVVKTIVNVLLYIIGVVAVIVIIIGAFRYVTSSGDASKVAAAKNTVLYAVIGLVVAILAFAIVNFVLAAFK